MAPPCRRRRTPNGVLVAWVRKLVPLACLAVASAAASGGANSSVQTSCGFCRIEAANWLIHWRGVLGSGVGCGCFETRVMRYAVCVKRTTIMLPDDVDARLRLEARRRGLSIAQVAREAIERELPPPTDGRLGFFAVGDGSPRDASERVDELVARSVRRRHSGRR